MNFGGMLWFCLGVMGFIICREALLFFDKPKPPVKIKTIVVGAIISLFGPLTFFVAIIWWICNGFEKHPLWTWFFIRPIVRALNYQPFKQRNKK